MFILSGLHPTAEQLLIYNWTNVKEALTFRLSIDGVINYLHLASNANISIRKTIILMKSYVANCPLYLLTQ